MKFLDLSIIKQRILRNDIIKSIKHDKVKCTFILEVAEPWNILGLPLSVTKALTSFLGNFQDLQTLGQYGTTFNRSDPDQIAAQALSVINGQVRYYRNECLRLFFGISNHARKIHSLALSWMVQNPSLSLNYQDNIIGMNQDSSLLDNLKSISEWEGLYTYVDIKSGIRNLFINDSLSPTSFSNDGLMSTIRWVISPQFKFDPYLIYTRHVSDHYNIEHYHIFESQQSFTSFQIYCLIRTWRQMKRLTSQAHINDIDRVNFGLQVINAPTLIPNRLNIALQALLVYREMVNVGTKPLYLLYDDVVNAANDFILPSCEFKRRSVYTIPFTTEQISLSFQYGLDYNSDRLWIPTTTTPFSINDIDGKRTISVSGPSNGQRIHEYISYYPVRPRLDTALNKLYHEPELYINDTQDVKDEFFYSINNRSEFSSNKEIYDKIVSLKSISINGMLEVIRRISNGFSQHKFRALLGSDLFQRYFKDSLPGLILYSYSTGLLPSGDITYNADTDKVKVDYFNLNVDSGMNQWTPIQLWNTYYLIRVIEMAISPHLMGTDYALKTDENVRVHLYNYKQEIIPLNSLFPKWNFIYRKTANIYLGETYDLKHLDLNVNANIIAFNLYAYDHSPEEAISIMLQFKDIRGVLSVFNLVGYDPDKLIDALNITMPESFRYGLLSDGVDFGVPNQVSLIFGSFITKAGVPIYPVFVNYGWDTVDDTTSQIDFGSILNVKLNINEMRSGIGPSGPEPELNFPVPGDIIQIDDQLMNHQKALGTMLSQCHFGVLTKFARTDEDKIVVSGNVSMKSYAIYNRRGKGSFLHNVNPDELSQLLYSDDSLSNVYQMGIMSPFEIITQAQKLYLYKLRHNSIAGNLDRPLIDLGSGNLDDIYLTNNLYTAVDRAHIALPDLPNVQTIIQEISPILEGDDVNENPTYTLLKNIDEDTDVIVFNSLFFQGPSINLAEVELNDIFSNHFKPWLRLLEGYVASHPQGTIYINIPYCTVQLFNKFNNLVQMYPIQITGSSDDDESSNVESIPDILSGDYLFYVKFGTHHKVLAANDTLLEMIIDYLPGTVLDIVPSKIEMSEAVLYNGKSPYFSHLSFIQEMSLLSRILVIKLNDTV